MMPEFKNKQEEIAYIKANKSDIIAMKKKAVKLTDPFSYSLKNGSSLKASKSQDTGVINKTFIANTYYWMDSHNDVHVGKTFKKSISENKNIFHLHDHEFKLVARVGDIQSIQEKEIAWSELGVEKDGNTTVLLVNSNISKERNISIYRDYADNKINQHSVGMYYVKIDLAINDREEEEEYKIWQNYIDQIGNIERAEEKCYFWAVKEAKLSEVSAVLLGSNELTGIYEPSSDTQKYIEDTQNEPSKSVINLLNNFKF